MNALMYNKNIWQLMHLMDDKLLGFQEKEIEVFGTFDKAYIKHWMKGFIWDVKLWRDVEHSQEYSINPTDISTRVVLPSKNI